jgi:hypothetical protein
MLWSSIATFAALTAVVKGQYDGEYSPPSYPSPWMRGGVDWAEAYEKAQAFVSQLTLLEKVNLTTGVGWEEGPCVGNTGTIPRLNFPGLCLQDSPLGVRDSKFSALNAFLQNANSKLADLNSAFPAGVNAAATWSTRLFKSRGNAMGSEHRDKGVDVQLGPVAGPLGRSPEGGRNWEGMSTQLSRDNAVAKSTARLQS